MGILDEFGLAGRTAAITGSNRGLGKAIAVALAEAGADIVHLNRGDTSATEREIIKRGRRSFLFPLDLNEAPPATCAEVVGKAAEAAGHLDILVNNAGTIARAPVLDHPPQEFHRVLHVNLVSAFNLAQAAGHHFVAQGRGKVINIISVLSFQGGINVPGYAAAKHGLLGVTRALANEWAGRGVNVNAIAPGYMITDNTEALRTDPARSEEILRRIPAGRWGSPSDVQGAAVFLSSDASNYVHGSVISVDGGWMSR
jgi:2-deoxy-D-gluconate 3-dehydrogenase